ncbi:uncharacterized protein VTP21DRAFT_9725 [Calcarisporiella thermophila]|uniref:uncharacterized protein n=1 Tax=Calcarisporiella thermophila TaxID=911321 RepID=UPI003743D61B
MLLFNLIRYKKSQYKPLYPHQVLGFRPTSLLSVLISLVLLTLVVAIFFFSFYGIEITLKPRFSNLEQLAAQPLSSCFSESGTSNTTMLPAATYVDIAPGIRINDGWDCYDFAATLQMDPRMPRSKVIYHTYWRTDLRPFGDKQVATLRSFFATQDGNYSTLYLWTSNADLASEPLIQQLASEFHSRFHVLHYSPEEVASGSPMENSSHLQLQDRSAYLDGDLVRLLVLYKYGGVWFDMDTLFVRDLAPLLHHEWLGQWDCYGPIGFPMNGALMRFNRKSPYVCEMLSDMARSPLPTRNSIDWGARLYYRVYRRLIKNGVRPWSVLPWCFHDSMLCRADNSMPNAFVDAEFPTERLMQVFSYHWHNQWDKKPGSLFQFLTRYHDQLLARS